jgi:hypothetical protein
MNKRTNGFVEIALLIVAAAALLGLGAFAYSKYTKENQTGTAVVYTTQLSDTIGTFRTEVNSSTANLNTQLDSLSSTVSAFGNITSQNIPLPVNAGGSGTTTLPTDAQFESAVGSTPTWKTLIFGGGLVTTTTATSVSINTAGIDPTQNYAWTGNNTHSGSETFTSSTEFTGSNLFTSTTEMQYPQFPNATSGLLLTDGSGHVTATTAARLIPHDAYGTETGTDYSTSSVSAAPVDATNLKISLSGLTLGEDILVSWSFAIKGSGSLSGCSFQVNDTTNNVNIGGYSGSVGTSYSNAFGSTVYVARSTSVTLELLYNTGGSGTVYVNNPTTGTPANIPAFTATPL